MKKLVFNTLALFCFFFVQAQEKKIIQTAPSKITQLIFSEPIKETHLENTEDFVLNKQGKLLNLSCLSETPIQTKLNITLEGGQSFSFLVENTQNASKLSYIIKDSKIEHSKSIDLLHVCKKVLKKPLPPPIDKHKRGLLSYLFPRKVETKNANLNLSLVRLIIHQNKMYFHIEIQNNSLLDFHIKEMAFEATSKMLKKKTSQTIRKFPLLATCQNTQKVPPLTTISEVLVLDSFSLEKKEKLLLEILEKTQGKRHLKLTIPNSILEKAKPLN